MLLWCQLGPFGLDLCNHLGDLRILVVLANSLKIKAIVFARIKSDKVDARILVYFFWTNLILQCYVLPKEMREVRSLVRYRLSIVKLCVMVRNKVHVLVGGNGLKLEFSDLFGK